MPRVSAVQETAEAVCGALHRFDWRPMYREDGSFESDDGASTWFIRGDSPKQVRIEVQRSKLADYVLVNVEWPVLGRERAYRGRQTLQIDVSNGITADVHEAAQRAVTRCLVIFRDVLEGSGVAAPK